MKKSLLFLGAMVVGASINAQTIYFSDDFEGGSLTANEAWTTNVSTDPDGTGYNWNYGTVGGNYARISNYTASTMTNHELYASLITPVINLSTATTPTLSFDNTKRYAGDDLAIYISTDYDGVSDPEVGFTWDNITSLFTLNSDIGSWTFTNSGDADLTAYAGQSNVYIAFDYSGSATDGSTWEVDNVILREGFTPAPTFTPIADVQATTSGDQSDMVGSSVNIGGIVQATNGGGFWLQDSNNPWSGIYVYDFGDNAPSIGDSVTLTGTVAEFAPGASTEKATQLSSISNFINVGPFTPYAPVVLSSAAINAEAYESMLVNTTNASCSDITPWASFGEYYVNDGSGNVLVTDFMYYTTPAPALSNLYSVTGIVGHNFGAYKLMPRDAADVVLLSAASVEENKLDVISVYPNPSNGVINIKNANGATINVYNSLGQKVVSTTNSKINLNSGLYFVNVNNQTIKVVVK